MNSWRGVVTVCVMILIAFLPRPLMAAAEGIVSVEVFKGRFASVNAYIVSNGSSLVIIDTLRKSEEAKELVARIASYNLPVTHVLVTHGHTDHFTGLPVMMAAFPAARVVVASEEIRKDIKSYAIYMDSFGATAAEPVLEPALRPKSEANPAGFDYENNIHVLEGSSLPMVGGGVLQLTINYKPAEADHATTVYIPEANALFLGDFGYNRVHFWMGDDISRRDVLNWREELLNIKARYSLLKPVIFPGHGDPTDSSVFDVGVQYIDDFLRVTDSVRSREEAIREMKALYPGYGESNFFLKYSVENFVRR
ncbi:MAG: MBL fold metallo-hydrolase [Pseudomonadota bacterium]|jgi:glyoxylase-like metal-dependent hydrolase (beta-lactamase superfamily II)